jgi:chemotaxis protein CheD
VNRPDENLPRIYLKPGEMHITDQPTRVITVLGSCLAVTMYCRRLAMGGICHGQLPLCDLKKPCAGNCLGCLKYVDCSILQMVKIFDQHQVKRSEIEVKCFGGADMFSRSGNRASVVSIGKQNIEAAQETLLGLGMQSIAHDVGGLQGRKIYFFTHTGEVFLKRLTNVNNPDIRW